MFKRLQKWWRKRQRNIDVEILWPSCKQIAPNISKARTAFFLHCINDDAWCDLSAEELVLFILELK